MMKKLLCVLLTLTLLLSAFGAGTAVMALSETDPELAGVMGDADGDGTLSTDDVVLVMGVIAGIEAPLAPEAFLLCDIDLDGVLTMKDARQILRATAHLQKLGPTGAFKGFDGGDVFSSREELVAYFNAQLNAVKDQMAGFQRRGDSTVSDVTVEEFSAAGHSMDAASLVSLLMKKLTESSEEDAAVITQPKGVSADGNMSVEGQRYVSLLTAADLFGAKASRKDGNITITIALKDVPVAEVAQSSYAKCFNTEEMNTQTESILESVFMTVSKDIGNLQLEYRDGTLTAVFDEATGNVISYTTSYFSDVYVVEASLSGSSLGSIPIIGNIFGNLSITVKGVKYTSGNKVEYSNFNW